MVKTSKIYMQNSLRKKIKNINKQQKLKRNQCYFFIKKHQHPILQTNEISIFSNSKNSFEKCGNINRSNNKANNKYFILKKIQGIFLSKDKMNYTSSNIKNKESIFLRNFNINNKTLKYSLNRQKENLKIKKKIKNINKAKNKMYISFNYIRFPKDFNTIF